jgi:hypothetical protein
VSAYDNDPRVVRVNDRDYRAANSITFGVRLNALPGWRACFDPVTGRWEAYREGIRHLAEFYPSADEAIRSLIGDPRRAPRRSVTAPPTRSRWSSPAPCGTGLPTV